MYRKEEDMERRCLPASEVRLDGDTEPKITGYAAVFDTWADIGGWFKESIKRGAFAKTIKEADIRALMNHDGNYVLGRNKAKTLRLWEDEKGLAVEIVPPDTQWARDMMASMKRGDISQMSFGFQVNKSEDDYEKDERILTDVSLFDVSVVTFPAYPTTSAQVRSAYQHEKREVPLSPPPQWVELDALVEKLKSGAVLTEEEIRALTTYIPSLPVPPAQHTETPLEPPAKHSEGDTRKVDRWTQLWLKEPNKP
jgi:HK97 family phage prohead protease